MITAGFVLEKRDEFIRRIQSFSDTDVFHTWWRQEHASVGIHETGKKMLEGLQHLLAVSEIVIWDRATQHVSWTGASDAFMEKDLPQTIFPTNQYWCHSDGLRTEFDKEEWFDWFRIEESCFCDFMLVTMTPPSSSAVFLPLVGIESGKEYFRWVHSGPLLTYTEVSAERGQVGPLTALCVAARLFLNTKIPNVSSVEVDKRLRKHWAKRRTEIPTIRFATLRELERHRYATSDSPVQVAWSHRWIVRSHWKMAACGPSLSDHRPAFVHTHIKGPEDKPLVIKQTIFNAVR